MPLDGGQNEIKKSCGHEQQLINLYTQLKFGGHVYTHKAKLSFKCDQYLNYPRVLQGPLCPGELRPGFQGHDHQMRCIRQAHSPASQGTSQGYQMPPPVCGLGNP